MATACSATGYLNRRLTGERRDGAAAYEGPWPVDPVARDWSGDPAAYDASGLSRGLLPDLVDPGGLLGRVTPEAAAATGLPAGLPVHATANDKAVEALGCGVVDDREGAPVLLSLGTYVAAMTPTPTRLGQDVAASGAWTNSACVPGRWLAESAGVRRGMWTVSWAERLLDGDLESLGAQAAAVPPGCDGLVAVLDWLAPTDAPHRRGALIGFDGTQGGGHVLRAVLEGVVLTMHEHVLALEEVLGRRHDEVVVSGGGSRSDLVAQLVADIFDRPVRRPVVRDAVLVGSAVCAAVGAGLHPTWEAAVDSMVGLDAPLVADPGAVAAYVGVARRHALARAGLDPLTRALAEAARTPPT